jgi:hypothetical protein
VITRRSVLLAGGIGLLVAHQFSRGQSLATTHRVGFLSSGSKTATANNYAAFKRGMQDLGWLEGNDVEYRIAYADGTGPVLSGTWVPSPGSPLRGAALSRDSWEKRHANNRPQERSNSHSD